MSRGIRLFIVFLLFFAMGTFFVITGIVDIVKASNAELDFNDMEKSEFKKGMFVKGTIYEILDEYAVEETYDETLGIKRNKRESASYYIVPMVGTYYDEYPLYVTVEIGNKDLRNQADVLMQQTWDYYETGTEPAKWNEIEIVGKVEQLSAELEGYLYNWFMYGDEGATRADYEPYICPYVIRYYSIEGMKTGLILFGIMAGIGAAGIAVFAVLFFRNRSRGY
ncbi:MAG: DUF6709 family protein [Oscillospiraceae bacterium]